MSVMAPHRPVPSAGRRGRGAALPRLKLKGPGRMPALIGGLAVGLLGLCLCSLVSLAALSPAHSTPTVVVAVHATPVAASAAETIDPATPFPTQVPMATSAPTDTPQPEPTATMTATTSPMTVATSLPTKTASPTAAPSATATPAPTDTPLPTAVPPPTATSAPTATPAPLVANVANLRSGPGTNYPVVGKTGAGQILEIVASNDERTWFELRDGSWIFADLVQSAPAVPVEANLPPLPAPTSASVPPPEPTLAPVAEPVATAIPSPPAQIAADTQELVSLTSPIAHGAYATITVRTNPGAMCSITVYYKSGPSEAQGLGLMVAGGDGLCSWTWKVGTRTTPGTWRIQVTTGSATQNYAFVVQ